MDKLSNMPTQNGQSFPTLTDVYPSIKTVNILKNLSYDTFSEMTALTTYLHQDWMWYPSRPEFADIMEKIAIVEMTHLDALSNAIVSFGGNPDYSLNGRFWSARATDLNVSLPSALKENIRSEEGAIRAYRKAIENVDNESLKLLFEKIIADEETHIAIFNEMLASL